VSANTEARKKIGTQIMKRLFKKKLEADELKGMQ
jgi:hypothetical protein